MSGDMTDERFRKVAWDLGFRVGVRGLIDRLSGAHYRFVTMRNWPSREERINKRLSITSAMQERIRAREAGRGRRRA